MVMYDFKLVYMIDLLGPGFDLTDRLCQSWWTTLDQKLKS